MTAISSVTVGTSGGPYPPDDSWAHRSDKMRCASCMWWVRKGTSELGRCRRHAPQLGGWPAVYAHDWCGDHKLDEAKA